MNYFLSVLSPFTAGGSLALTWIGAASSLGGNIASIIPDKRFQDSIEEIKSLHNDLLNFDGKRMEKLMILYSLSAKYLKDFEFSREMNDA